MYNYLIITGCYRSGTSVLVQILNRHPNIFITDESWYFFNDKVKTDMFFNKIKRLINNKLMIEERPIIEERKVGGYDNLKKVNTKLYLEALAIKVTPKLEYFGDKFPEYVLYLDQLKINNNFKFIMCVRDPREVIASQLYNYKRLISKYNSIFQHWWAKESVQECINSNRSWIDYILAWDKIKKYYNYYEFNYTKYANNLVSEVGLLSKFLNVDAKILLDSFNEMFKPKLKHWREVCPEINNYLPDDWKRLMEKYGFSL